MGYLPLNTAKNNTVRLLEIMFVIILYRVVY